MKRMVTIFLPTGALALAGEWLHWSPLFVFFAAAAGVVPLAALLGRSTEELAAYTGPRVGGLLNATPGNAAELIITITAISAGAANPELRESLMRLVKASITGSILGNLLFILGLAILIGGIRHGRQKFDRVQAGASGTMLLLAVAALAIPSLFGHAMAGKEIAEVEYLSIGVAVVMIVIYALGIVFALRRGGAEGAERNPETHHPSWSVRSAVLVLLAATVAIALLSDALVKSVEPVVERLGVSELFLGIIVIPIVGNVAEHVVAVQMASKNRMELALSIAIGSSLQVALLVAPLLVFISLAVGNPLTLTFDTFELISLFAAALIAAFIAQDGESNWLEGAQLLAVYMIIGMAFFYLPG